MNPRLTIPCLSDGNAASVLRPQPIMQFKELEVDAVRYTAWQCSCALDKANRERMAKRAASLAKTQVDP